MIGEQSRQKALLKRHDVGQLEAGTVIVPQKIATNSL